MVKSTQAGKLSIVILPLVFIASLDRTSFASSVKNCEVTFSTTAKPVLVKIEGKSLKLCQGNVVLNSGSFSEAEFQMDLSELDTGIPLRNKHLRENYLHTEKFPSASVLVSAVDDLENQFKGSGNASAFRGDLVLMGIKKPIKDGKYQIEGKKITANFTIELTDYGIARPTFMGVKIVDVVIVTVTFDVDG